MICYLISIYALFLVYQCTYIYIGISTLMKESCHFQVHRLVRLKKNDQLRYTIGGCTTILEIMLQKLQI